MHSRVLTPILAATALVVVLHAGPVRAQNPDASFAVEAGGGGLAEVELGRLATQRASDPAVRDFGQRMVTDHGNGNAELMALARQKGIALPAEPPAHHRAMRDRLSGLAGPEFDRAYMRAMVDDHVKDVAAFEREAAQGRDPDLKAWAAKTLPTLRDHLTQARSIDSRIAGVIPPAPGVVAASPGTTTTVITTTTTPAAPWCAGAWHPTLGTNLAACLPTNRP